MIKMLAVFLSFSILFTSLAPSYAQALNYAQQQKNRFSADFQGDAWQNYAAGLTQSLQEGIEQAAQQAALEQSEGLALMKAAQKAKEAYGTNYIAQTAAAVWKASLEGKKEICLQEECFDLVTLARGVFHTGLNEVPQNQEEKISAWNYGLEKKGQTRPLAQLVQTAGVWSKDSKAASDYFKAILQTKGVCEKGFNIKPNSQDAVDYSRYDEPRCEAALESMAALAVLGGTDNARAIYAFMNDKKREAMGGAVVMQGVTALMAMDSPQSYDYLTRFLTKDSTPTYAGTALEEIGYATVEGVISLFQENGQDVAGRYLNPYTARFGYLDEETAKQQQPTADLWMIKQQTELFGGSKDKWQLPVGNIYEDVGSMVAADVQNERSRELAGQIFAASQNSKLGRFPFPLLVGLLTGNKGEWTYKHGGQEAVAALKRLQKVDFTDLNEGTQRRLRRRVAIAQQAHEAFTAAELPATDLQKQREKLAALRGYSVAPQFTQDTRVSRYDRRDQAKFDRYNKQKTARALGRAVDIAILLVLLPRLLQGLCSVGSRGLAALRNARQLKQPLSKAAATAVADASKPLAQRVAQTAKTTGKTASAAPKYSLVTMEDGKTISLVPEGVQLEPVSAAKATISATGEASAPMQRSAAQANKAISDIKNTVTKRFGAADQQAFRETLQSKLAQASSSKRASTGRGQLTVQEKAAIYQDSYSVVYQQQQEALHSLALEEQARAFVNYASQNTAPARVIRHIPLKVRLQAAWSAFNQNLLQTVRNVTTKKVGAATALSIGAVGNPAFTGATTEIGSIARGLQAPIVFVSDYAGGLGSKTLQLRNLVAPGLNAPRNLGQSVVSLQASKNLAASFVSGRVGAADMLARVIFPAGVANFSGVFSPAAIDAAFKADGAAAAAVFCPNKQASFVMQQAAEAETLTDKTLAVPVKSRFFSTEGRINSQAIREYAATLLNKYKPNTALVLSMNGLGSFVERLSDNTATRKYAVQLQQAVEKAIEETNKSFVLMPDGEQTDEFYQSLLERSLKGLLAKMDLPAEVKEQLEKAFAAAVVEEINFSAVEDKQMDTPASRVLRQAEKDLKDEDLAAAVVGIMNNALHMTDKAIMHVSGQKYVDLFLKNAVELLKSSKAIPQDRFDEVKAWIENGARNIDFGLFSSLAKKMAEQPAQRENTFSDVRKASKEAEVILNKKEPRSSDLVKIIKSAAFDKHKYAAFEILYRRGLLNHSIQQMPETVRNRILRGFLGKNLYELYSLDWFKDDLENIHDQHINIQFGTTPEESAQLERLKQVRYNEEEVIPITSSEWGTGAVPFEPAKTNRALIESSVRTLQYIKDNIIDGIAKKKYVRYEDNIPVFYRGRNGTLENTPRIMLSYSAIPKVNKFLSKIFLAEKKGFKVPKGYVIALDEEGKMKYVMPKGNLDIVEHNKATKPYRNRKKPMQIAVNSEFSSSDMVEIANIMEKNKEAAFEIGLNSPSSFKHFLLFHALFIGNDIANTLTGQFKPYMEQVGGLAGNNAMGGVGYLTPFVGGYAMKLVTKYGHVVSTLAVYGAVLAALLYSIFGMGMYGTYEVAKDATFLDVAKELGLPTIIMVLGASILNTAVQTMLNIYKDPVSRSSAHLNFANNKNFSRLGVIVLTFAFNAAGLNWSAIVPLVVGMLMLSTGLFFNTPIFARAQAAKKAQKALQKKKDKEYARMNLPQRVNLFLNRMKEEKIAKEKELQKAAWTKEFKQIYRHEFIKRPEVRDISLRVAYLYASYAASLLVLNQALTEIMLKLARVWWLPTGEAATAIAPKLLDEVVQRGKAMGALAVALCLTSTTVMRGLSNYLIRKRIATDDQLSGISIPVIALTTAALFFAPMDTIWISCGSFLLALLLYAGTAVPGQLDAARMQNFVTALYKQKKAALDKENKTPEDLNLAKEKLSAEEKYIASRAAARYSYMNGKGIIGISVAALMAFFFSDKLDAANLNTWQQSIFSFVRHITFAAADESNTLTIDRLVLFYAAIAAVLLNIKNLHLIRAGWSLFKKKKVYPQDITAGTVNAATFGINAKNAQMKLTSLEKDINEINGLIFEHSNSSERKLTDMLKRLYKINNRLIAVGEILGKQTIQKQAEQLRYVVAVFGKLQEHNDVSAMFVKEYTALQKALQNGQMSYLPEGLYALPKAYERYESAYILYMEIGQLVHNIRQADVSSDTYSKLVGYYYRALEDLAIYKKANPSDARRADKLEQEIKTYIEQAQKMDHSKTIQVPQKDKENLLLINTAKK